MLTQLGALATGVQSAFPRGGYTGITTKVVVDLGKVPEQMVSGTAAAPVLRHAHGGTVSIGPCDVGGGTGNAVTLHVTDIPSSACTDFLINTQHSWDAIGKPSAGSRKTYGGGPMTQALIVAACQSGDDWFPSCD